MFNEGDGDIAQGRRELRANPGSSDLQKERIACFENT